MSRVFTMLEQLFAHKTVQSSHYLTLWTEICPENCTEIWSQNASVSLASRGKGLLYHK